MPLAHVLTCGRELRLPEAFSPQALKRVDLGQQLSSCRQAICMGGSMRSSTL
jgi:hypothetical protein